MRVNFDQFTSINFLVYDTMNKEYSEVLLGYEKVVFDAVEDIQLSLSSEVNQNYLLIFQDKTKVYSE